MKNLFARLSAALILILPTMAPADEVDHGVVVELFTSQGCSSCPPADKFLHELASREGVIPLALHVDYWDYIGWKDIFARPDNTKRQHAYAIAAGRRSVYTPQMIVQGHEDVVGNHPVDVSDLIRRHAAAVPPVRLNLERSGGRLVISAEATGPVPAPMVVHLVRYEPNADVTITRGENAGRTLSYANIVRDWARVAEWDGRDVMRVSADLDGDLPVVVILQHRGVGPIIAAARMR